MVHRVKRVLRYNLEFVGHSVSDVVRSRKRVLYFGWLGERNFGDEALFYCIERLLTDKVRLYGSNKVSRLLIRNFLEKHYFDFLMLGGGTFINVNKEVVDYINDKRKYIQDMVVFGTGAVNGEFWESVKGWRDMSYKWADILSDCRLIGVRGPDSLEYLRKLGIDHAKVIGDPVLILGYDMVKKKERKKRVGVNFGFSRDRLWGKSDLRFAKKILSVCKVLHTHGWDISFFSVWPTDTSFIKECLDSEFAGSIEFDIFNAWEHDISTAMKYFDGIDVFIAEKLHAGIVAACTYTPFIMFEYRTKCRDFMKSVDLLDLNIRTDRVDIDRVVYEVNSLYEDVDRYQRHLYERVQFYRQQLKDFAGQILTTFDC